MPSWRSPDQIDHFRFLVLMSPRDRIGDLVFVGAPKRMSDFAKGADDKKADIPEHVIPRGK